MPAPADNPTPGLEAKTVSDNVRETLESIVVAFVLAFIFRAFIVEAFVIPTGSMASTLYGEQLMNTCSTCGYQYALGVTTGEADAAKTRSDSKRLQCPNCGLQRDTCKAADIARPNSGDRILVHKWPFDVPGGFLGPRRWDVTVFKDPKDGKTNFIKRLVGLPGEILEIIDGDIYAARLKDLPDALRAEVTDEFDELRRAVYDFRNGDTDPTASSRIDDLYSSLNKKILPHLRIQRKIEENPLAQESLWFNVYNHDYLPNYESVREDQQVGWWPVDTAADEVWDTGSRVVTFKGKLGDPVRAIQFRGKEIEDFYAYNNNGGGGRRGNGPRGNLVGDLRLRFTWIPKQGASAGELVLQMNRDDDTFIATIRMDGTCTLGARGPRFGPSDLVQPVSPDGECNPFTDGRACRIEFINVDYRVQLLVDGEKVCKTGDKDYSPRPEDLQVFCEPSPTGWYGGGGSQVKPSEVRIGARDIECELRHVVLERDVYYRSQPQEEQTGEPAEQGQRGIRNAFYHWPGWGTAGRPILLRTTLPQDDLAFGGEYFMLGDNSPASKDSRLWWEVGAHLEYLGDQYQLGTVLGDQLIGKAFFVYWPAGYRPWWSGGIGLVPNFGQMRFIR